MKAMKSELLMYKQQVVEYRNDLENVRNSFSILQEEYFKMIRKNKRNHGRYGGGDDDDGRSRMNSRMDSRGGDGSRMDSSSRGDYYGREQQSVTPFVANGGDDVGRLPTFISKTINEEQVEEDEQLLPPESIEEKIASEKTEF